MSTIEEDSQDSIEQWTLEDLNHYWMPDGLPVFIADFPDICDVVESMGFNIYYLLANEEKEVKVTPNSTVNYNNANKTAQVTPQPTTKLVYNAQLFKVVTNFVGRSVSPTTSPFPEEFLSLEQSCTYTMPPIPHIFVEKLDQFFRLVDAQHGTESIVLLTYDLEKQGPDGWGILVPDQTNTSVHCNYDPHSIAEVKPDNVMIVGSVHSHPGMAAYASGTDHADQADFDGIHITFGWQKTVNNGTTQYHIELQMSGKTFTLSPEDVFEDYIIDKAPDPEVVEWTSKVKKVSPPNTGGFQSTTTPHHTTAQTTTQKTLPGFMDHGTTSGFPFSLLPNFSGLEPDSIVVVEVERRNNEALYCPCCEALVDDYDVYFSYCDFCKVPFSQKDQKPYQIIDNLAYYCKRFSISTNGPAYLWCPSNGSEDFLIRITPGTLQEEIDDFSTKGLDTYYEDYVSDVLINSNISQELLQTFEKLTSSINVYSSNSNCSSCDNYYDIKCPFYAEQILTFQKDPYLEPELFENVIFGEDCSYFIPYPSSSYSEKEEYYYH
jgi:hypothetical protein